MIKIMKTEKSWWVRLSETAWRAWRQKEAVAATLPELDQEQNDRTLARVSDEDPALRVVMSYAQTHIENNLRQAFNPALTPEQRIGFLDRTGAVAALVEDVETNRLRLRSELAERQRAADRKRQQ